jgi:DNA uptake protein ComE-like DNA-binding protein
MVQENRYKNQENQVNHGNCCLLDKFEASSGMALIAVLWIVAILTVMASEFIYSMQLEVRISKNWGDQVSALYTAKAGLEEAIAILKVDEKEYDSLDEDWAQELTGELNDSNYTTTLTDESARININTVDEATLTKVITYCMDSANTDVMQEDNTAEAQTLATAIIEKRPFRTVAEIAKVVGMTPELLYGKSAGVSNTQAKKNENTDSGNTNSGNTSSAEGNQTVILADICTVYSADKNVNSAGEKRVNINTANANDIQQNVNPQGQGVITQQEAQAIVDYRNQQGQGQNQSGQNQGQNQLAQTGGQAGQGNQGFKGITQLLDVPAISQETFNSISSRITVSSSGNNQNQGQNQNQNQNQVNINTADANALQGLSNRIDRGIADSIVRYRQNRQFANINEIMQVKAISIDDIRAIVDMITTTDDAVITGKVNINTASQEILQILPGMDETKAQAIVNRRTVTENQASTNQDDQQGPFNNLGQLMDVEGIDQNTFRGIIDMLTCRSSTYRIASEGRSLDGKIIQNCTAVVDRSGNRIEIKYWKQE